jgi:hypothetical protein
MHRPHLNSSEIWRRLQVIQRERMRHDASLDPDRAMRLAIGEMEQLMTAVHRLHSPYRCLSGGMALTDPSQRRSLKPAAGSVSPPSPCFSGPPNQSPPAEKRTAASLKARHRQLTCST